MNSSEIKTNVETGRSASLAPFRVLDLTQDESLLAGRMMAELGAEVIQVEPPGGNPSRNRGPYYKDLADREKSLVWWGFCVNKKSVLLDITTKKDRRVFQQLARTADFVLESFTPGYLESLALGYTSLANINPRIIMASITPFGQTGPKAHYKSSELISWASSGVLYASGDPDRPPVATATPLAGQMGATAAVLGCMVAHWHREHSGQGQQVDISLQEVGDWLTLGNVMFWPCHKMIGPRVGWGRAFRNVILNRRFQCQDGWAHLGLQTTTRWGLSAFTRLLQWIQEEGTLPNWVNEYDWSDFDPNKLESQEEFESYIQPIKDFALTKTKADIWREKKNRDLLAAPVRDFGDNFEDPHLRARGFWTDIYHPELKEVVTYPGACFHLTKSSLEFRSRAPLMGEHTNEVLAQLNQKKSHPDIKQAFNLKRKYPLEGIKVLDLGTEGVNPVNCKHLADFGATVVSVETHLSPSLTRLTRPLYNADINGSMLYGNWNTSKLSVSLNLETSEGRELCHKLVCWADVIAAGRRESWLKKWGIDYDNAKKMNPEIVYFLTSNLGVRGPDSGSVGLGHLTSALMGSNHLCGWPDRGPSNVSGTIGDTVNFMHGAIAILAALEYRRRIGKGQLIDHSQVETYLWMQSPWVLDYSLNQRIWSRSGNRYKYASSVPYGVFPCKEQYDMDRWVAICVTNDKEWQNLCHATGQPDWIGNERFCTTDARRKNEEELCTFLSAWTKDQLANEIEARLQEAGVPAHVVATSRDEFEDRHLADRGFFRPLKHTELGEVPYCAPIISLSGTPDCQQAAPCLGEHNEYVFKELLGVPEEEYIQAILQGGITTEKDFPTLKGVIK